MNFQQRVKNVVKTAKTLKNRLSKENTQTLNANNDQLINGNVNGNTGKGFANLVKNIVIPNAAVQNTSTSRNTGNYGNDKITAAAAEIKSTEEVSYNSYKNQLNQPNYLDYHNNLIERSNINDDYNGNNRLFTENYLPLSGDNSFDHNLRDIPNQTRV